MNAGVQLAFSFSPSYSVWDSSLRNDTTHSGPSLFSQASLETPSQAQAEICVLSDSRCIPVDCKDELSELALEQVLIMCHAKSDFSTMEINGSSHIKAFALAQATGGVALLLRKKENKKVHFINQLLNLNSVQVQPVTEAAREIGNTQCAQDTHHVQQNLSFRSSISIIPQAQKEGSQNSRNEPLHLQIKCYFSSYSSGDSTISFGKSHQVP